MAAKHRRRASRDSSRGHEAERRDDAVREFSAAHNPAALKEIADRLAEAQSRGLWTSRHNSAYQRLAAWAKGEAA